MSDLMNIIRTYEEACAVFAVLNQPDIPSAAEPVRERLRALVLQDIKRAAYDAKVREMERRDV